MVLATAGCGEKQLPEVEPEVEPMSEPTTIDVLPFPTDDAPMEEPSYEPTYSEPVEREALYVVMPVAGGKALQAASLHFDDGEVWIRSYRPVVEELQYADKRVVVTGRPYENSPYVQSVIGTHFELATIQLAHGETPYDPLPTRIPAPPFVEDRAALEARVGLWAHCVGVLTRLEPPADDRPWWGAGTLRLADGTELGMDAIPYGDGAPQVEQGQEATVLTLVLAPREEGGQPTLGGPVRICAGRVERCLMDDAWQQDGMKR